MTTPETGPTADGSPDDSPDAAPAQRPLPAVSPRSRGRAAIVTAGAVAAVAAIGYGLAYALVGDSLPRGAVIAGVEVGGLAPVAAEQRLRAAFEQESGAALPVEVGGDIERVDPSAAGLAVDYTASLERAGSGRSGDPRHVWRALAGGGTTDLVIAVDRRRLDGVLGSLAAEHDVTPRSARLAYEVSGEDVAVRARPARTGAALDQAAAAAVIADGWLRAAAPLRLPVSAVEPAITDTEAAEVARQVAEPAVASPIRVRAGGAGTAVITPAMIADALTFVDRDGTLTPTLDPVALRAAARPALAEFALVAGRDATVKLVKGKPQVIPSVDGTTVTADALAAAVEPALARTGRDRAASVEPSARPAAFSTDDARALGITEVTGKFTTRFPYLPYRNTNIGRAAELINGTVLKPGEVFSLNDIVGERTAANGFAEGFVISGGKFRRELGGGVSQSATTTYNAMFFAGLEDLEHKPHTLFIDRYPAGREATVSWPRTDLRFRNNTEYGVLVQAFLKPGSWGRQGSITVRMWSTKTWDEVIATDTVRSRYTYGRDVVDTSPECEPMSPVPGFDARYERHFIRDGTVVAREKFFWRYNPTDRVRCG